jgi:protein-tyrosine-phosphatase
MYAEAEKFLPELARYLDARVAEFNRIPAERKRELGSLADIISEMLQTNHEAKLTFICTHNSRRSHLAQIWAEIAAAYFDVTGISTYSGGTEATAFNPRAVAALQRTGLKISKLNGDQNPRYEIRSGWTAQAKQAFSKVYDQVPNPQEGFLAVMTCSQADEACPIVSGCSRRIAITYDDPKAFDGTDQETEKYDERSRQICREMLYAFSRVTK